MAQWQRACFASRRPWVQIPPSPLTFLSAERKLNQRKIERKFNQRKKTREKRKKIVRLRSASKRMQALDRFQNKTLREEGVWIRCADLHFPRGKCVFMKLCKVFRGSSCCFKPYSEWLGLSGEEGRGKLRKAWGSRMQALNPRYPNYSERSAYAPN